MHRNHGAADRGRPSSLSDVGSNSEDAKTRISPIVANPAEHVFH